MKFLIVEPSPLPIVIPLGYMSCHLHLLDLITLTILGELNTKFHIVKPSALSILIPFRSKYSHQDPISLPWTSCCSTCAGK